MADHNESPDPQRRRIRPPRRLIPAVVVALVAACGSPAPLPGAPEHLEVSMTEYHFAVTGSISAGRVVFTVRNDGHLNHEMVVVPLPADVPPIDQQLHSGTRRALQTLAILPRHTPGTAGRFSVDLEPGRYAFICFVEDPDGVNHALKGMSTELSVSP